MSTKNISVVMRKAVVLMLLPVCLTPHGCIRTEDVDCGVYLEFKYDYNMSYSDIFRTEVKTVDVFVFDESGEYMFTRHSAREELTGGNRMLLSDGLSPGKQYKILTVGGLPGDFSVSEAGGGPVAGITRLEDIQIALKRETNIVSKQFTPVWVGPAITIDYSADMSTWPVSLIKNTNRFHLTLSRTEREVGKGAAAPSLSFEIVTPEGAVYDHDNSPLSRENVTYTAYELMPGEEPEETVKGNLNTVRLLYGGEYGYRLNVRNIENDQILWDYDLMKILEHTKETPPDVLSIPMQEYLDRKSEWDITVYYQGTLDPEGFIAVKVKVNNWIVWMHEMEL